MKFDLCTIVSVTSERLVCNNFADVHELLDYMTNSSLFTHELPHAADTCKPYILKQYPELNSEVDNYIEQYVQTYPCFTIDELRTDLMTRYNLQESYNLLQNHEIKT